MPRKGNPKYEDASDLECAAGGCENKRQPDLIVCEECDRQIEAGKDICAACDYLFTPTRSTNIYCPNCRTR